jgi:4-hydroxy-tetrahydrodipicolinate synthase
MANRNSLLNGIVTAMVTPIKDQRTVDKEGLERLIEHLLAGGVHGVFPLGTTGEAPALSAEMRLEVITLTCRQIASRVPVIVCVTDNSLVEAIRFAKIAKDAGATAIATAPPYYYSLTQDEILTYCEKLAAQAGIPLLLYNAPGNTHDVLQVNTVRRAAEIENIVGLKDSGFNMIYFHEVRASLANRKDFSLLVGPDELLAECVLLGGQGGMAAGSNINPRLFVDLYNAASTGDLQRAVKLHQEVIAFGRAVYHGENPLRGLKCGLEALGICNSLLTEPLKEYSQEQRRVVERYVDEHRSEILAQATPTR